jgi:pimeloyl-ACP methyl ester carboxylesterase
MDRRQLFDEGFTRTTLHAGRTFSVLRAGDDGDPVLFVPGFTGSKEDFVRVLAPTAALGYTAIAVDQRGQFETPGCEIGEAEHEADYSMRALASDLLAIMDALSGRVHVVGHSFGGLVARTAAIMTPDKFASLVLMDSGPAALTGAPRQRLEYLRPVLLANGVEVVYQAMVALAATEPGYEATPADLEEFMHRRFVTSSVTGLLGMGQSLLNEPDHTEALRASGVRTLVLHGTDEDVWLSEVQDEMAQRLNAPLIVIDKAAHSPALDNPIATIDVLKKFWSQV